MTAGRWTGISVLWRVRDGRLPGARRIGETTRHSRRLFRRCGGDGVVVHALGGRPSNRALPGEIRESGLAIAAESVSADCGPTLRSEHLESGYGPQVKAYTSWQWRVDAGLWERSRRSAKRPWRRSRRVGLGEPGQRESRAHARLEHRTAGEPVLNATPEDATSRLVVARLAARDDGGRTGIVESLIRTW